MSDQSRSESAREIRVVGFDLDNTLYHSTAQMQSRIRTQIYEKLAHEFSIPVEEARRLFEENYNGNFAWGGSGSRTIKEIARQYGKEADGSSIVQESLEEADLADLIEPDPELVEMLKRLASNRRLDLLTGSRRSLCMSKLEKIGIPLNLFGLILSDEDGSKTDGSLYQKWINTVSALPDTLLYVGDNLRQDIESAKKKGIRTCYLNRDGKALEIADFCISNIMNLEIILRV